VAVTSAPDELSLGEEPDARVHHRRVLVARFLVVASFLAVWHVTVAIGLVDAFWISSPVLVVDELWRQLASGELIGDVTITVFEALIAFVVSSALGIVAGLLLARSPFWDEVLAPLVLALNSLPRVALAPLIILWFGIGITAKVVTAFTLVFFILLVNKTPFGYERRPTQRFETTFAPRSPKRSGNAGHLRAAGSPSAPAARQLR
jgi:ABC-type nitrate/sulfonate/bicarbonate transport system permease component